MSGLRTAEDPTQSDNAGLRARALSVRQLRPEAARRMRPPQRWDRETATGSAGFPWPVPSLVDHWETQISTNRRNWFSLLDWRSGRALLAQSPAHHLGLSAW